MGSKLGLLVALATLTGCGGTSWPVVRSTGRPAPSTSTGSVQRPVPWPFTPVGPVTHQSSQDHVPAQAAVLRISWTAQRHDIIIRDAAQVQRVAHVLGELPKESQGACAEGLIYGSPTIEFAFRTPSGRVLATPPRLPTKSSGSPGVSRPSSQSETIHPFGSKAEVTSLSKPRMS